MKSEIGDKHVWSCPIVSGYDNPIGDEYSPYLNAEGLEVGSVVCISNFNIDPVLLPFIFF